MRVWREPQQIDVPSELRSVVGGHPLVARILAQRGITDPALARAFLDPAYYYPAAARSLPGIAQACDMITRAVTTNQRIRVWGDFDVDGQTSTALLYEVLTLLGARVDYALPLRREGHGLSSRAIVQAETDNITLLITCDTGISDALSIEQASRAGIHVIVTDHHDLPDSLPPADCIVNPKLLPEQHPCYHLSGVGVAYMLARGLLEGSALEKNLPGLLDLTAIGLIADVAYQAGDVRYLVQSGLQALRRTLRPGLRALFTAAQLDVEHATEEDIGFQIAPRLNAAGRLADAELALALLLAADSGQAQQLAEQLEALNRDRQARTEATISAAERRLRLEPELVRQPVLVIDDEDWDEGVLGLVAAAMVQRYQRPAIIISHRAGSNSIGSARSLNGIDIHQAIGSQAHLLAGQGGHPLAAGFTMPRENTAQFRRGVIEWVSHQEITEPSELLVIDAGLPWNEIDLNLAREIRRLAPFGPGNPKPVLSTGGVILLRTEDVSRKSPTLHRRLFCSDTSGHQLQFVWFNAGNSQLPEPGQALQVAFTIQPSYWKNRERLSLELIEWRPYVPALCEHAENLVAGVELLDWRQKDNTFALLDRLRASYGDQLAVWAEGLQEVPQDCLSRWQLADLQPKPTALVVLTAPPGAEVFERVLRTVQPQVLVLLPPLNQREITAQEFIRLVHGMVRASLADPTRRGALDTERMAARLGTRAEAIVAALRGLEASQVIRLTLSGGTLQAACPGTLPGDEETLTEPDAGDIEQRHQAVEQAKAALLYQLREARAYRQAYQVVSPIALFTLEEKRAMLSGSL